MGKKLIIFGTGKISEVVSYYFNEFSEYDLTAYTVDGEYNNKTHKDGIPVVDFEVIQDQYSPSQYDLFVAIGYQDLNKIRANKCMIARRKGYRLTSFLHPNSCIPKDCIYGDNCFFMSNSLIQPRVTLGDNVFIWSGALVGHHSIIGDNCWLTSGCNISGSVRIGDNCFLAVNSTVTNSIKIGDSCFIGANTLINKKANDGEVYIEPATKPIRLTSSEFLRMSNFDQQ